MYLGAVDGIIKKAFPEGRGTCPACGDEIIAKCGDIKMWHWAHKQSDSECIGDGSEAETQWHREWKEAVPVEWCERIIKVDNRLGRADILKPISCPIVYEFQHSYISPEAIAQRENFYLNIARIGMVWVFDIGQGTTWQSGENAGDDRLHIQPRQAVPGDDIRFYWENGKTSILHTRTQLYLDLGSFYIGTVDVPHLMILVHTFSNSGKFGGVGQLITKQMFLDHELLFYLPSMGADEPSKAYRNIVQFEYA